MTVVGTSRAEDTSRGQALPQTVVLHDYLTQQGGAERVALTLATGLGDNRVTTCVFAPASTYPEFGSVRVTELAPGVPSGLKRARASMAPVAARAFRRHCAEADVVVCSSSGWSHWTGTAAPTVVYCHTPPRWFWAPQDYVLGLPGPLRRPAAGLLAAGRRIDRRHALGRTRYVANSSVVRDRIHGSYGIDADVVHPPVSLDRDGAAMPVPGLDQGFVLLVARDRAYKNVEAAARLFAPGELGRLVVVGTADVPPGGWVTATGRVSDAQLRWLYASCRAVLALSHEDFGLTPVEGHLFGKPTVALRAGGYLDTCVEGVNAVFADDLSPRSLYDAVRSLDRTCFDAAAVADTARRYSVASYLAQMAEIVTAVAGR